MADCYFLSSKFCTILLRVVLLGVHYFAGLSNAQCPSNTCARPEQTLRDTPGILPSLADCYEDGKIVVMMCNLGFRSVNSNYTTICNGENGKFEADATCRIDLLSVFVASILDMFALAVGAVLLCYAIQIFKSHKTKDHDIPNDVARNEPVIRAVYRAYEEPEPVVELCYGRRAYDEPEPVAELCYGRRDMACQTGEGESIYANCPAI